MGVINKKNLKPFKIHIKNDVKNYKGSTLNRIESHDLKEAQA
jgi:hypothetical protein